MYLEQTRLRLLGIVIALFITFFSSSAQAQQPELTEAFVYGINATTPGEVFATLSPPQVDEIYILADRISMLTPRRTKLFYWPLTQSYRANWTELNEPLDGVLEISDGNRVISTVNMETYTVHYLVAGSTRGELHIDSEAVEADNRFQNAQEAYLEAMTEFRLTRLQWLAEARKARQAGEPLPLNEEPRRPAPFTTLSVGLQQGFPLKLDAGEYQIRMRGEQGEIITDSQRTLHVFESRQTNLGFEIIPEEEWTIPEQVNEATEAILAEPGSVIYLQPRLVHEYPALAIERLRNSQFDGSVERKWAWVTDFGQTNISDDVLEVIRRGKVIERINHASYSVRFAFEDLRYEILPYDADNPGLTPRVDFTGYRIQLPQGRDTFTIRLGPEANPPYDGNVRRVWVIPEDLSFLLIPVLVFIFALAAALLLLWQRRVKRA